MCCLACSISVCDLGYMVLFTIGFYFFFSALRLVCLSACFASSVLFLLFFVCLVLRLCFVCFLILSCFNCFLLVFMCCLFCVCFSICVFFNCFHSVLVVACFVSDHGLLSFHWLSLFILYILYVFR